MGSAVPVLEVGGSHVTAAVVSPDGWTVRIVERAGLESRGPAELILDQLRAAAEKLPLTTGLAIALPGPFDYPAGVAWYRGVDKFDALYGLDVGHELRDRLSIDRVVFVNDAEAFAVGEWRAGELLGLDRCVGVTVGTGIGSAFLAGGVVVRTGDTVPPGGELYRTEYRGRPLEDSISARAILRAYFTRTGRDEPAIGVKEIADRARAGETTAREVLLDSFGALADALTPWLDRFGVTKTVLGGAISGAFDLVESVFPTPTTATTDTEHSAIIGTATHYLRT